MCPGKSMLALENRFGVDLSPFYDRFPVPIGDICEKLGIEVVFDSDMEEDLHGQINYRCSEDKFVIRVNDKHSAYNNIFTIAHEIGHYLIHFNDVRRFGFADRRVRDRYKVGIKRERVANEFAASILMPDEKFTSVFVARGGDLIALEKFFRVSQEAVRYRALNLGLILG
jgi:Zn-dependent peptidase ImmA (M78 family)